jgi:serine/threonine protein kinase
VQCTSLSQAGGTAIPAAATIADFEFMKQISSGAYASVYLARKTRTGDIYAIQVIPNVTLHQMNEVRRVRAQNHILINVISSFMLKFSYSIIRKHNRDLLMEYLPPRDLDSILLNIESIPQADANIYTALR